MNVDEPMKLYYDNKAAINLVNNHVIYNCTKYIEIDWHFIKEKFDSKELILSYMKYENQVVDMFTKELSSGDLKEM